MIEKDTILFVLHPKSQCGVYEFGKGILEALQKSKKYNFIGVECGSMNDLMNSIKQHNPSAIIYNYHPSVMPRITTEVIPYILYKSKICDINIPQIGIIHEVTQNIINNASIKRKLYIGGFQNQLFRVHKAVINQLFDYYIAPDPTLKINHSNIFQTGRLIPQYTNSYPLPNKVTIGSFGFGTTNKGFEEIVKHVQNEYDEAIVRFNIPFASFGDPLGENAKKIATNCKDIITKSGITIQVTHNFFSKTEMLDFLAQNTINVFLYQNSPREARGISSVIENALAVKRPICISKSSMFRHISKSKPSIYIDDSTIKNIINNGFTPLEIYFQNRSEDGIISEYEKIIDSIL